MILMHHLFTLGMPSSHVSSAVTEVKKEEKPVEEDQDADESHVSLSDEESSENEQGSDKQTEYETTHDGDAEEDEKLIFMRIITTRKKGAWVSKYDIYIISTYH